ncbi:hypothetical protein STEG23_028150 [Scotinomys teguina]
MPPTVTLNVVTMVFNKVEEEYFASDSSYSFLSYTILHGICNGSKCVTHNFIHTFKDLWFHSEVMIPPTRFHTARIKVLESAAPFPANEHLKEDLNLCSKKLTHTAPCMLFMKGTPQEPRCDFSKQMVEILHKHNIQFSSFDIFSDEEVQQGLKTYSNWPTYLQLYVSGELIGGLDIIKELEASEELDTICPKTPKLEEKLKVLTNKASVMLFMKRNKQEAKCGFSKQILEILNSTGVDYETFDILEDEEMRQGLKPFSNWPTYPQLYVRGELVGGLDIVKELKDNGELLPILKGEN